MSWSKGPVDERRRLIEQWEQGSTPTELARRFAITRPTVYTTIQRWQEYGEEGLVERSRRPMSNSRQTSTETTSALLALKDRYPRWGPDKLVRLLANQGIELSASTARDILRRNGRVEARRARPPLWSPVQTPAISVPSAGHSMSTDYKGQFRLGSGHYCYPLTIADPASKYILAVEALANTNVESAWKVFERVFREHGLPEQIITDNGNPFCCARSIGGITMLSKMWIKLNIQHVRIQPGRPQQNGSHERMHKTLKDSATKPPARTLRGQQKAFDSFRQEFNHIRPHQALGQQTPSTTFRSYRRPYPTHIEPIEYPSSFEARSVRSDGCIKWRGENLFISQVLTGERIALVNAGEDHVWKVYFGNVCLAVWDERARKFSAPTPPARYLYQGSPLLVPPLGEDATTPSSGVKDVSVGL